MCDSDSIKSFPKEAYQSVRDPAGLWNDIYVRMSMGDSKTLDRQQRNSCLQDLWAVI